MDDTFTGGAAYLENPEILLRFFSKSSERARVAEARPSGREFRPLQSLPNGRASARVPIVEPSLTVGLQVSESP